MSLQAKQRLTPAEYLAHERQADTKSEYYNGALLAMASASRSHNLIVANMTGELRAQLRGRACEVYPADMRVKVSETGLYTYPDVVVVCGEPAFEDEHVDTLLNPTLIVEVLSPSTEAYDRGEKFAQYRKLASLHEYLMIAQDRFRIEHYVRQGKGQWLLTEASDLGDTVHLPSIGCDLQLSEAYDRVTIGASDEPRGGAPGSGPDGATAV
jgi:Uma2 family endonuclease